MSCFGIGLLTNLGTFTVMATTVDVVLRRGEKKYMRVKFVCGIHYGNQFLRNKLMKTMIILSAITWAIALPLLLNQTHFFSLSLNQEGFVMGCKRQFKLKLKWSTRHAITL